ncbi:MAG: fumarylacetoacetate hydrolase family protein [Bacillota bacterium]|jgi:2-dehydro-3-deoxy-D-arabinonate dehydratase|nr:fumarylacetoacetate hydrolase [Bacillota bacterium]
MRIIRFLNDPHSPVLAAVTDDRRIYPLPYTDFLELVRTAERRGETPLMLLRQVLSSLEPLKRSFEELALLVPIEAPEVWACGVTYERSRDARNAESGGGEGGMTCYDKVYEAERPEIFLKSTAARTVGPHQPVYLRSDSSWQVPEPELGLVLDRNGRILGYTAGNDMSSRDIEGENPLYLPQAKIWRHSCSIGPSIRLAETVEDPYRFEISCRIYRGGRKVFEESATTGRMKRKMEELVSFLIRDNPIFDGTVLLTGTCIVPPDDFTLREGDRIEIEISGIGTLTNYVKAPVPQY